MKTTKNICVGLGLLASFALAAPAEATQKEIRWLNGGRGQMVDADKIVQQKQNASNDGSVRLTGTLRYSPAKGLTMGRTPIGLTGMTSVYPVSKQDWRPHQLHGKVMTVFGKPLPDGTVEAVLMIQADSKAGGLQLQKGPTTLPEGFTPSDTEPMVGSIEEDIGG